MDSLAVRQLVARAKAGEQAAFADLYEEYAAPIYRFIKIRISQTDQAEDILQETFFKAWQALPKLKLEALNFSAWLYRIARNLVNDHYRRVYRRPAQEDIDEHLELAAEVEIEGDLDQTMEIAKVRTMLPKLKTEYQQVIELRFIQEFSIAETAKVLKRSPVAVRLLQYRALARLRLLLD